MGSVQPACRGYPDKPLSAATSIPTAPLALPSRGTPRAGLFGTGAPRSAAWCGRQPRSTALRDGKCHRTTSHLGILEAAGLEPTGERELFQGTHLQAGRLRCMRPRPMAFECTAHCSGESCRTGPFRAAPRPVAVRARPVAARVRPLWAFPHRQRGPDPPGLGLCRGTCSPSLGISSPWRDISISPLRGGEFGRIPCRIGEACTPPRIGDRCIPLRIGEGCSPPRTGGFGSPSPRVREFRSPSPRIGKFDRIPCRIEGFGPPSPRFAEFRSPPPRFRELQSPPPRFGEFRFPPPRFGEGLGEG